MVESKNGRGVQSEVASEKKRTLAFGLLLVILVLGMTLRLYVLDSDGLWFDETKTVLTSRLDFLSILDFQAERSVHPPLLYIVTHLCLRLFGDSDFIARLPSALFGSLSILVAYKVGETLWTRTEGLLGAFLLSFNAYHVRYSQEARHYALMVFLVLLSLIFLLKALQRNEKGLWIGFALCTSLGLYTHYFAFLVLPAELLYAAWVILENWLLRRHEGKYADLDNAAPRELNAQPREEGRLSPPLGLGISRSFPLPSPRKQALGLVASLTLVGVSYLPWLPRLQQQLFAQRIGFQGLGGGTVPRIELSVEFFHGVLRSYSGVDGVPLLLFLGLFVLGLASCRRRHILLIALWTAVPFLFTFVVSAKHFFHLRYTLFVVPIYLLAIATGATSVSRLLDRRFRTIAAGRNWFPVLTSASMVLFGVLSVAPLKDYYSSQTRDWRGVAEYLKANLRPEDIVLVDGDTGRVGADGMASRTLSFYFDRQGMTATPILRIRQGLGEAIAQNPEQESGDVWLAHFHRKRLARVEAHDEITMVRFKDVSIIRLREPSGDMLQDTVLVLEALPGRVLAPEARFDIHLALAEIYLETGSHEQAGSHIVAANLVVPDDELAVVDLAEASTRLQPFLHVEPEDIRLGDVLSLPGYSMHPRSVAAGVAVHTTLSWQAVGNMDRDYTVFIHVVDQDDHIWAQQDRLLQHGDRRTPTWAAGEIAWEEYELRLPPDTPPGEYVIKVGVYYWETGERLPVRDEGGERAAGDAILLGTITVIE